MTQTQTNTMIEYRRLRAPAHDGEALCDPPLAAAEAIVAQNVALLRDANVGGRPLPELAAEARRLLLNDARRYTAAYRDVDAPSTATSSAAWPRASERILLAGHQPQLFHPGVLFKNFALSALGQRLGATAVNLVIDNDVAGAPSLRVPAGSLGAPSLAAISFDEPAPRVPFEERKIVDGETFAGFGRRVQASLRPFVANPLVAQLWEYAAAAQRESENLGRCLAQARHRLEADWGLQTFELPLSEVCRTPPFARFVAALVGDLPRFADIYNRAIWEYRRVHRLRSRTHPAPDLAVEGEWREAPFWVWSREDPTRRRLFARRAGRCEVELTDRDRWTLRLRLCPHTEPEAAVERLVRLGEEGVKLRPRALTTTLYARLVLGDLFLHGIGGAKYDQLTDALIARYFGVTPPTFYAVTATVLLPLPRPQVAETDVRRVEQRLRELRYHPERFLDGRAGEAATWVEAKRRWLTADAPGGAGRARHRGIAEANAALQPWVEPQRRLLQQERASLLEELRKKRLLGSREFSFCLFPQDYLPPLLHRLLEAQSHQDGSSIPEN